MRGAPLDFTYTRYLSAKKTVDDRSLNRTVVEALRQALPAGQEALEVLELGGGLGTMVARAVDWGLCRRARWTLLDSDEPSLGDARAWLSAWALGRGGSAEPTGAGGLRLLSAGRFEVEVAFVHADATAPPAGLPRAGLLVANAFLDLVDVPTVLPGLLQLLAPGGLYWFGINFDGLSAFLPAHPDDDAVLATYHHSMDVRLRGGRRAGHSQTGRRLLEALQAGPGTLLAAGASDWVVLPGPGGTYAADEAYFLHHIIHTVDEELRRWPAEVSQERRAAWVAARHADIQAGRLTYLAHQLDFAGRT